MCKTTAIIFILIFSILFGLEKFVSISGVHLNTLYGLNLTVFLEYFQHCQLLAIVLLISGGLFMFTYESTQFNFKGFLLVCNSVH